MTEQQKQFEVNRLKFMETVRKIPGRLSELSDQAGGFRLSVLERYFEDSARELERRIELQMRALKGDLPLGWSKDEETPAEDRTLEFEP